MNEAFFTELSAWLNQAGLAGTSETDIVSGLCDRCVAAGLPLARTQVFIDTLHPVHEGRLFRWGFGPTEPPLLDYGRTTPDALAASGSHPLDVKAAERWRRSPFYKMLQTGDSILRRRLSTATEDEFSPLPDLLAAGMTDYVAIITCFAAEGVIGEMDGVYSSWATRAPGGFNDCQIAALQRVAALSAAIAARQSVAELKKRRALDGKPVTDMYLGLHVGEVFYGNVGSRERLDFTVIGPAVNEANRIAAMCRSVDQPVLMSAAFADVGNIKRRLVSVGRYALRGVAHPQELFTIDPYS